MTAQKTMVGITVMRGGLFTRHRRQLDLGPSLLFSDEEAVPFAGAAASRGRLGGSLRDNLGHDGHADFQFLDPAAVDDGADLDSLAVGGSVGTCLVGDGSATFGRTRCLGARGHLEPVKRGDDNWE